MSPGVPRGAPGAPGAALLACALLSGCASTNPRPAFVDVQNAVKSRSGQSAEWARGSDETAALEPAVDSLLAGELTVDRAVAVALLNNPTLQASFEEIGLAQADLAQAARIANPEVAALLRWPHQGSGSNTELLFVQDVFDVFLQPLRKKMAASDLERTKLRLASEALSLAAEAKRAFFTLQARQQLVQRLRRVQDITQTAADFAQKLHDAGNLAELPLQSQIALDRQSRVDVAVAEAAVRADREALNRLLGLWGPRTQWRIADELPSLPEAEIPLEGLESYAMARRYDLQAARFGVDHVGRALALRRKTRFFPVGIQVGIDSEKDLSGERVTGPELRLQLPIFDTGSASIARLESEHRRAQRQLEALAVNARSEVREARDRMLAARDLATYYATVLLPQRVRIFELNLRYYNSMFKGAFDLLLAKREEVEAEKAHVEAWRDFWIARADLERSLGGSLPGTSGPPLAAPPKQED